jgi:hypothetical protein
MYKNKQTGRDMSCTMRLSYHIVPLCPSMVRGFTFESVAGTFSVLPAEVLMIFFPTVCPVNNTLSISLLTDSFNCPPYNTGGTISF